MDQSKPTVFEGISINVNMIEKTKEEGLHCTQINSDSAEQFVIKTETSLVKEPGINMEILGKKSAEALPLPDVSLDHSDKGKNSVELSSSMNEKDVNQVCESNDKASNDDQNNLQDAEVHESKLSRQTGKKRKNADQMLTPGAIIDIREFRPLRSCRTAHSDTSVHKINSSNRETRSQNSRHSQKLLAGKNSADSVEMAVKLRNRKSPSVEKPLQAAKFRTPVKAEKLKEGASIEKKADILTTSIKGEVDGKEKRGDNVTPLTREESRLTREMTKQLEEVSRVKPQTSEADSRSEDSTPGRITRKARSTQRIWKLDIVGDAFDRWRKIGSSQDLNSDTEIAAFLMEFYESMLKGSQTAVVCDTCRHPLTLSCALCCTARRSQRNTTRPCSSPVVKSLSSPEVHDKHRHHAEQMEVCINDEEVIKEDSRRILRSQTIKLEVEEGQTPSSKFSLPDKVSEAVTLSPKRSRPQVTSTSDSTSLSSTTSSPKQSALVVKQSTPSTRPSSKPIKPITPSAPKQPKVSSSSKTVSSATVSSDLMDDSSQEESDSPFSRPNASSPVLDSASNTERPHSEYLSELMATGMKRWICQECGATFARSGGLKVHMRIHTGEKPYVCKQCGKGFNQTISLIVHLRKHSGERPYTCKECSSSFPLAATLKQHMRIHTGEKPFTCLECKKAFSRSGDLASHLRSHTGQKPYLCQVCGKAFASSSDLTKHKRTHSGERPYECPECGKLFPFQHRLTAHMRSHTGDRPFLCQECGAAFARASNLTVHYRIHTGDKPFKCEECGKAFSDSGNLCKHRRSSHGGSGKKPAANSLQTVALASNSSQKPSDLAAAISSIPQSQTLNLHSVYDTDENFASSFYKLHGLSHENELMPPFDKQRSLGPTGRDVYGHSVEHDQVSTTGISPEQETSPVESFTQQFSPSMISSESKNQETMFKCEDCLAGFPDPDLLNKHIELSHPSQKKMFILQGSTEQYGSSAIPFSDPHYTSPEGGAAVFPYYSATSMNFYYHQH